MISVHQKAGLCPWLEGLTGYLREALDQSRRLPLLRGYSEARRLLAAAVAAADEALQAMAEQQASARQEAIAQVALAQEALLKARVAGARVHLQSAGRQALIQQEIALEEAQRNLIRGDYDAATHKASQVRAP